MGVTGVLAYLEGSNLERGAKSRPCAVFETAVKRGRLSGGALGRAGQAGEDVLGGVTEMEGEGEGLDRRSEMAVRNGARRGKELDEGRRLVVLPEELGVKLLWRCLVLMSGVGVREPWKLLVRLFPTTLLAGELPGVSTKLLASDRSLDITVETESRSCLSRALFVTSSSTRSSSRMSACNVVHLRFMSACKRRISPLTVSLSSTPLSMIARTLSIAGP